MVPFCQGLPHLSLLRLHGLVTVLAPFHPLNLGVLFHTPALVRFPFWSFSLFEGRLVFRKIPSSLHVSFRQGPDLFNRVWIKPHAQSVVHQRVRTVCVGCYSSAIADSPLRFCPSRVCPVPEMDRVSPLLLSWA